MAFLLFCDGVRAQSFRLAGTQLNAKRSVSIPAGPSEGPGTRPSDARSYRVVVTEFFHHGQIRREGANVVVAARNRQLVPRRVLQLGPGDFCRLAFQTVEGQDRYEIFYGGDPPTQSPPPWTNQDGLLLETRHYRQCNLRSVDSVRKAFNASTRFGSDYVENVHHARNPFSLKPLPFLSRYSGYLHISSPGTYGLMTSSQDCSFLLIDGKPVVAAPGRHAPARRARPGSRKDIRLSAGRHPFEYYHAAAGSRAMMVAAWQLNPRQAKPAPRLIPGEVFHNGSIGRVAAGPVELRTTRLVPDYRVTLAGDVPLPDNPLPLIGVRFQDNSPKALRLSGKPQWDFGDGQTSDKPNPEHVYLRPGVYTVKLTRKRGGRAMEMTNRVCIDRPPLTSKDRDKLHKLDDYLPVLETYDPRSLDPAALRQLVLAYEAKALALEAAGGRGRAERAPGILGTVGSLRSTTATPPEEPKPPSSRDPARKKGPPGAKQYVAAAVAAGQVAFLDPPSGAPTRTGSNGQSAPPVGSTPAGPPEPAAEDLYKLAALVGPMARDRLGDSQLAFDIWQGAVQKINTPALQARCATEAADIAVSDLLDAAAAKTLLDAATANLRGSTSEQADAQLQRVWGDYSALRGKGRDAREAYRKAEQLLDSARSYVERTARRGAYSRSTEAFLIRDRYDRAIAEIRAWQREFPAAKIDGYLTLLYARYWAGRGAWAQAISQAEQLMAVNADSPYADRLLLLAADCQLRRGRVDRALATLHSLVNDYPGSPLVPAANKKIARLEAGKKN